MEENDVVGARQPAGGTMQSVLRFSTPGRCEFGVDIDGAIHADGRQHFRQHVQQRLLTLAKSRAHRSSERSIMR